MSTQKDTIEGQRGVPDLDLAITGFTRHLGDIVLYGSWYGPEHRPCLVVAPAFRRTYRPVVILLEDAWRWEPSLGDAAYVTGFVPGALRALGMEPTPSLCARLANLVNDHIGDLITMKPYNLAKAVVADALVVDAAGHETHHEVRDYAKQ